MGHMIVHKRLYRIVPVVRQGFPVVIHHRMLLVVCIDAGVEVFDRTVLGVNILLGPATGRFGVQSGFEFFKIVLFEVEIFHFG